MTNLNKRLSKAMILSAGLGTRLKPWTDLHPKALAVVNGKSLLQRNIEYLQAFGISEVIVNVHHFAEQIVEAVEVKKGWGSRITISDESDALLETGGGLKKAAWFFESDFVLMNVDILTDLDISSMFNEHISQQSLATLAVSDRQTSRYFLFDKESNLCGWRNNSSGEERLVRHTPMLIQKAFSGIHIISPAIFAEMGQQGKFSMVEVYLDLARSNFIKAFDHTHAKFIDVGKPEAIKKAEELFA